MSKKDTSHVAGNRFHQFIARHTTYKGRPFVQIGDRDIALVRLQKQPVGRHLPQGFFLIAGTEREVQTVAYKVESQLRFAAKAVDNPGHTRVQLPLQG